MLWAATCDVTYWGIVLMIKQLVCALMCFIFLDHTNAQEFAIRETDATIEIHGRGRLLLCYNKVSPKVPSGVDAVFERTGFLHPVCSPGGKTVTASFPFDHPHQQGIFSAWVKTKHNGQEIDFWNLKKRTGRVVHKRVVDVFSNAKATGFVVQLIHRSELTPPVDILRETWRVTAVPTDGSFHCFDLHTKQEALTSDPLQIEKFHYGGLAVRGPVAWLRGNESAPGSEEDKRQVASGLFNSLGSDRIKGNHEKPNWVTLWGGTQGTSVSITVLCGQASFRAPQSTRLHPTKPYFCFCPAVDGKFEIAYQKPYQAHYRFLIRDSKPASEWVESQWRSYVQK